MLDERKKLYPSDNQETRFIIVARLKPAGVLKVGGTSVQHDYVKYKFVVIANQ